MIKTIIWDWNGTLFNDVKICLDVINTLLKKRNLASLSLNYYLEIFTFPVKDYYLAAGFNFEDEPFEKPAEEFILCYQQLLHRASLFDDVEAVLSHYREKGFRQFILSAMKHEALKQSVQDNGITHFFEQVCGIENNLAFSKAGRAKKMMEYANIRSSEAIMVGDTLHDVEVADEIGVDVILIGRGHQSQSRLRVAGKILLPDLLSLKAMV
ncbi:MAG TPA: HAD hydrolase-like protein [Bacteroidales bacterium]|nr:HAD hydrolase-like protein [Bacteroidales bacterium]